MPEVVVAEAAICYDLETVGGAESALLDIHHFHRLHLAHIVHDCRRACFQNLYFRVRAGNRIVAR